MKSDIPLFDLTPAIGPGSRKETEALNYLPMPREMHTFELPSLPEEAALAAAPDGLKMLGRLQEALDEYRPGLATRTLGLDALDEPSLQLLNQLLGEGEVALQIDGRVRVRAQETVLAGVWWVQQLAQDDALERQWLEVADVPSVARSQAFAGQRIPPSPEGPTAGVMNATPVLVELLEAARKLERAPGAEPHVINLSLLPFSAADHACLAERLGQGQVVILSRGYGNCRIGATAVPGIWRVQYFNSTDQLILDTLEVVAMPQVACAAPEDLQDSALRLREIREVLA